MPRLLSATLLLTLAPVGQALAHPHHDHQLGEQASFLAGFAHPFFGLDHVLAMVAVGLWAAMLGGRALWMVPAAFVAVMLVGFALALGDVRLPMVEPFILTSVIVLGLLVALAVTVPVAAGAALVGFFALFHGHAHGSEMGAAGMLTYGGGFALATAILHGVGLLTGLGLGRLIEGPSGTLLARAGGGLAALGGVWLMIAG